MKVICYGDSNTYGFDPRMGSSGRLPRNQRWTGILNAMPEFEIIGEGMNGRTIPTAEASYRWLGKVIKKNWDADALVIMLGTNDMFMVSGATAEVLAAIKTKYPDGELDETDGVSIEYPRFRFNVRPSGTEPLLRLNVESRGDAALLADKTNELLEIIKQFA